MARYLVEQGAQLSADGHHHKARLVLKDAIKHDTACADAYGMIGDSYAAEGRIDDAVKWWERLARAVPERAGEVFERLEDHLYDLGEFERMAGIYERFLDETPGNLEATLAYADLLQRKGQVEGSIELLTRLRQDVDDPGRVDRKLVLLYNRAGDRERALSLALAICERELNEEIASTEGDAIGSARSPGWVTTGGAWDPSLEEEDRP